ncbi:hypothetical protein CY34DRAFT_16659 [Suillus luteus UH-Slu-Lm8-n1]|uniref:Uncharacterized protein n=1 Tax=Suillus luteus UH-Slu-Lm8-n1 TaxID=930992 RepID=A0A0C9ZEZ6_9AGAM|nr:hypothetical protein CY34DRAFT_16659 [Suillus luteus UH-Slu-Lm8-n1]
MRHQPLESSLITFPFAWDCMSHSLMAASGVTAHPRYLAWYAKSARGVKRPEHPDSPGPGNEPSSSNTHPRTNPDATVTVSGNSAQPSAASSAHDNAQHDDGKSKSKSKSKAGGKRSGKGKGRAK